MSSLNSDIFGTHHGHRTTSIDNASFWIGIKQAIRAQIRHFYKRHLKVALLPISSGQLAIWKMTGQHILHSAGDEVCQNSMGHLPDLRSCMTHVPRRISKKERRKYGAIAGRPKTRIDSNLNRRSDVLVMIFSTASGS